MLCLRPKPWLTAEMISRTGPGCGGTSPTRGDAPFLGQGASKGWPLQGTGASPFTLTLGDSEGTPFPELPTFTEAFLATSAQLNISLCPGLPPSPLQELFPKTVPQ